MACTSSALSPDWIKDLRCTTREPASIRLGNISADVDVPEITTDSHYYFEITGNRTAKVTQEARLILDFDQVRKIWPETGISTERGDAILQSIERLKRAVEIFKELGYPIDTNKVQDRYWEFHTAYCIAFILDFAPFSADLEINRYVSRVLFERAEIKKDYLGFPEAGVILTGLVQSGQKLNHPERQI